jgi:hypothetical protein
MKNALVTLTLGLLVAPLAFAAPEEKGGPLWYCTPAAESSGLEYVSIENYFASDGEEFTMTIGRSRPFDDVETESGEAIYLDDFNVNGYGSEELDADLLFYYEGDEGGARDVFVEKGQETLMTCDFVAETEE